MLSSKPSQNPPTRKASHQLHIFGHSTLVDQQYPWALVMLDFPGELTIGFGGAKPVDHVNGGGKKHAIAAQTCRIAQRDGQMAFSDTS